MTVSSIIYLIKDTPMPDMACDNKVIQWSRRISIAATFHDTRAHLYMHTHLQTTHLHKTRPYIRVYFNANRKRFFCKVTTRHRQYSTITMCKRKYLIVFRSLVNPLLINNVSNIFNKIKLPYSKLRDLDFLEGIQSYENFPFDFFPRDILDNADLAAR